VHRHAVESSDTQLTEQIGDLVADGAQDRPGQQQNSAASQPFNFGAQHAYPSRAEDDSSGVTGVDEVLGALSRCRCRRAGRRSRHRLAQPASTRSTCPVIYDASSEARNAAAAPISAGSAHRPSRMPNALTTPARTSSAVMSC
jgi:hypothetical protein